MDRITIINDALLVTGNEQLNVEFDGSPEWTVAESAYRRAVRWALSKKTWNFATTSADLVGLLSSSPSKVLDKAYALPADCLHIETAFLNTAPLTEYELIDNKFCCRFDSGVSLKYVRAPLPGQWPGGFVELVTIKTEAYILRGLNEDTDNARRRDNDAVNELNELRTQVDQQEPGQVVFRSRTGERRLGFRRANRFTRPPYGGVP